ncbi:hypothetical protein [Streptomyces sp. NPDC007346]|uniref:hypothetical protein n=1 Tax=Streptomyces sp. NPDC007346 TaxID=3154682 RepID=UPI003456B5CF
MTVVVDVCVAVADAVLLAVVTGHIWGPVLLALLATVAVALVWRYRPSGRHRTSRTPAWTSARTSVRPGVDTSVDPAGAPALTCADTCPDVSADTCPDLPGHDERGAR